MATAARAGNPGRGWIARLATPAFTAAVCAVLHAGWTTRDSGELTAESGAGYALGVAGAVMMGLLVLYPVRKQAPFMRSWGAVRHWFRAHMMLGVLGPVCVLFHCGFGARSLNGKVALVAMLVVVASGIVGRYLYGKIHHGLYGRRASLDELRRDLEGDGRRLATLTELAPELRARMAALEAAACELPAGLAGSFVRLVGVGVATRAMVWTVALRTLAKTAGDDHRRAAEARRCVAGWAGSTRRVAQFSFYARLFALWHVLHVPLFVMLAISTLAHVVAVHRY